MRISLNWLKDYVDIAGMDPHAVAATLTALGLEVESVEEIRPVAGEVVTGKIVGWQRHPGADKLSLCQVDVGGETLDIVCGAPNARSGLTVAVAKVGAVLPGDFKIKPATIRGVKSFGMMLSEKELGISERHDGIIELAADLAPGLAVMDLFHMNDTVLVLGLTPNRADCLGYIGVARELAGKLGKKLKLPDPSAAPTDKGLDTKGHLTVHIENPEECGRFLGLFVADVTPLPSPGWMQRRLTAAGMRPINLIVDATNYVMLEYSHPIHAYDEREIVGGRLAVRKAHALESLTTLDGVKRTLETDDLVICNGERAVGLAGVMGGADSEIKPDTRNIIIEVAHFHPRLIRKTAKRVAIHTEASHRFERGVDIAKADTVIRRVGQLIVSCAKELAQSGIEIQIPRIAHDVVDAYPVPVVPTRIALRLERARKILGEALLTRDECSCHLSAIGFALLDKTNERMLWEVPSHRNDIEREIDLIEEIARVRGYDRIPYTLPMMEIAPTPESRYIDFIDAVKLFFAHNGYAETISFPFVGAADLDALNLSACHPMRSTVALANPLVESEGQLAPSAAIALLKAISGTRRRGASGSRLFEVSRNFYAFSPQFSWQEYPSFAHLSHQGRHISPRAQKDARPTERYVVGGVLDQPYLQKSWDSPQVDASFYHGKSSVHALLANFGIHQVTYRPITANEAPWLNPTRAAMVTAGGAMVGYVGELHPKSGAAFDLLVDALPILFELDLDLIFAASAQPHLIASVAHKFPPVTRDLAFVLDHSITFDRLEDAIGRFKKKLHLVRYELFDLYEGANLPAGKKSMALAFHFQSDTRTLTDVEVQTEIDALIAWMKEALGAALR